MILNNRPLARSLPVPRSIVRIGRHLAAFALLLGLASPRASADESSADGARAQFARGVELADKGEYEAALQAFSDAYATSPNFAVLYNIGQAQVALGRPKEAAATLSRYLREGQDNVPPERRQQVEDQIKLLESFLVELDVTTDPAGATISVDGREVGPTPISEPLRLTAGKHRISASLDQAPPDGSAPGPLPDAKIADCSAGKASVAVQAQTPAEPVPVRGGLRKALPYALAGAGVALGAGALAVYLWRRGDYERWQAGEGALRNETPGSAAYQARATENQRLAASLTTANHTIVGLSIAGGVLVAAGASLYIFDWAEARKSTRLTVAWGGGASVAAGWRWSW